MFNSTPAALSVMSRFVVLSGCSGGGKSTLLAELSKRGFGAVEEPGRRIVVQEQLSAGVALPWKDVQAFLKRALEMALNDLGNASPAEGWVFFDRGLVDAASALAQITSVPLSNYLGVQRTYHRQVFLTPPWPEIYVTDAERQHPLSDAIEEYERLLIDYPLLGYEVVIVPKDTVPARADFVLEQLSL